MGFVSSGPILPWPNVGDGCIACIVEGTPLLGERCSIAACHPTRFANEMHGGIKSFVN
ncbi:hypothetical protein GGTG_04299 [Gaeumannomyces tritici R3-111a-1]|uniref:Uncharacterized protein n=1 Tax=Gaeumannomyces tritici (strain R3-111a-1) TaxID=644352 RepID=J3NSQ0_GAET3|nr:hypothetical protein GGTG_04299 [Gaeumannomyces tritici R3-111a-1]EJT79213.1 hypothetical protein GGTG_04299 [Gaeumannomyces tritici R3-111a-1]